MSYLVSICQTQGIHKKIEIHGYLIILADPQMSGIAPPANPRVYTFSVL